jgi:hypothetical protein
MSVIAGYFLIKYIIKRIKIKYAGYKGEKISKKVFKGLSKEYKVFHNVRFTLDGKRTEIDCLIVSRAGLFIVEVKNYKGILRGSDQGTWTQTKVTKNSNLYTNEIRNPITQVSGQIHALSKYLKRNKQRAWIDGFVLFTHPQCDLKVSSDKVKLMVLNASSNNKILTMIRKSGTKNSLSQQEVSKIIEVIEILIP